MVRLLLQTLLGFALFFGSVIFGYFYLQHPDDELLSLLFIALALICLILSALVMLVAARGTDTYVDKGNKEIAYNDPSIVTTSLEGTLRKHNSIVSQWRKTAQMRDQMKVLRVSNVAKKNNQ